MGCLWYAVNPLGLFEPLVGAMALHELGHLLALRSYGVAVTGLSITALGCVLQTRPMSWRSEALCAAAGPGASLLAALILAQLQPKLALVSLALGLFNLLPLWPLDGGRILRSLLLRRYLPDTVQRIEMVVSGILGAVAAALALFAAGALHLGLWPAVLAAAILGRAGWARREEKAVAKKARRRYNKRTNEGTIPTATRRRRRSETPLRAGRARAAAQRK